MALLVDGRRDVLEDQLEQRREVGPESVRVGLERGTTCLRVAVDDRKLDLALVGVEVEEERVDLVDDVGDARVGAVDLVDDEDDGKSRLERLAEHEARLRQRALARVDEQQDAVDHRQPALDLTAEVGMARRVDDVDLHGAVADGGVLGQDRDPLLAFELPGIEDPLGDVLVRAEGARTARAAHRRGSSCRDRRGRRWRRCGCRSAAALAEGTRGGDPTSTTPTALEQDPKRER